MGAEGNGRLVGSFTGKEGRREKMYMVEDGGREDKKDTHRVSHQKTLYMRERREGNKGEKGEVKDREREREQRRGFRQNLLQGLFGDRI